MAQTKALYRKYRPTKLEEVVGQEQVTKTLSNALKQGKISHAYLFIGPRGTGKTSVARILAHAVNGFDYQVEDHYLDIIEIDAASNTGVDNIRELREKAVIAPTKGKYKVYIIDEVHMLTKSASNALLKTLEEPPEHVIFIMATTDAYKVPITISSRTQVHTFKLADSATMQKHLRQIADQEKIPITDEALEVVVRRGGGSFRDSLSLLDQIASLSKGEITAEIITGALGLPQNQALNDLLQAYAGQDQAKIHQLLQDLLNTGVKPEIIASELIRTIIDHPEPGFLPLLAKLPEVQPPFPEAKLLLALLQTGANITAPGVGAQMATQSSQAMPQMRPKIAHQAISETTPETVPQTAPKTPVSAPEKTPKSPETPPSAPQSAETPESPSHQGPKNEAASVAPSAKGEFNWESFIENIKNANPAICNQLLKTDHLFDGQTLHIYPQHKFTKNILDKPGNTQLMGQFLGGIPLLIHEIDEQKPCEDGTISEISAIMGGVKEVKGEMPF